MTVMVVFAEFESPSAFVQVRVSNSVEGGLIPLKPPVAETEPVKFASPLAVQETAFVTLQFTTELPPAAILAGVTFKMMAGGAHTVPVQDWLVGGTVPGLHRPFATKVGIPPVVTSVS
jgi:hypothetical protein